VNWSRAYVHQSIPARLRDMKMDVCVIAEILNAVKVDPTASRLPRTCNSVLADLTEAKILKVSTSQPTFATVYS
jgi:hypothetical protein